MSPQTSMYTLKPINCLSRVTHSKKIVYEMKNIHEEVTEVDHRSNFVTEQKPLPEYKALEARQEKILQQLGELRKQVSTLCTFLKQSNSNRPEPTKDHTNLKPVEISVVIKTNPRTPPHSLLALSKCWSDTDVRIQQSVHSSIVEKAPEFNVPSARCSKINIINAYVVWKEVDELEFVLGLNHHPIKGEVNLLRFLSRLIQSHRYEHLHPTQVNKIDTLLDLSHCLQFDDKPEKIQEILSSMVDNLTLDEQSNFDISHVAAWSSIKNLPTKKLPPNLKKWYANCDKTFT